MNQLDLFEDATNHPASPGLHTIRDGAYYFQPDFFTKAESDAFFASLKAQIQWRQESMQLYGKQVNFPRLSAWYGEKETTYTFSGVTHHPHPWTDDLININQRISPLAGVVFNSVLLNLYRDGNDSIAWHTDAEPELGQHPVIASVNFGATRKFQLRHMQTKEKIEIPLTHGSLLIMQGALQHHWQHQVPKTSKPVKERVNLTFRVIKY